MIIDKFDMSAAYDTSHDFFKKESINFVAIDGTEYSAQFFDMVKFYAEAYSCSGTIDLNKNFNNSRWLYFRTGRSYAICNII